MAVNFPAKPHNPFAQRRFGRDNVHLLHFTRK